MLKNRSASNAFQTYATEEQKETKKQQVEKAEADKKAKAADFKLMPPPKKVSTTINSHHPTTPSKGMK